MFHLLSKSKLFFNVVQENKFSLIITKFIDVTPDFLATQKRFTACDNIKDLPCICKPTAAKKEAAKSSKEGSAEDCKKSSNGDNKKGSDESSNGGSSKKGGGSSKKKYKSVVRHNFSPSCEDAINKQINMELYAAYWYTSLQHHFDRDDIALLGFSKYFKAAAAEELVHAENLMVFIMKRGGVIKYLPIEPPPVVEWTAAIAVAESMELEKQVTKSLEDLADLASDQKDDHLNDYICGVFLTEQFAAIKELGNLLARIRRAGPGVGLVIVDGELLENRKEKV